ncbi:hypothetical protein DFH07DRAFT_960291 [Mycena maculata]|uniref:Uncharacterized protein n=1 Tax=Mycena maculata TaxID=230809 RepID=A0AAD7IYI1_9AGAR|nr:hypothetical protein DFH07DRAFT_960291 [Mycena maculata]
MLQDPITPSRYSRRCNSRAFLVPDIAVTLPLPNRYLWSRIILRALTLPPSNTVEETAHARRKDGLPYLFDSSLAYDAWERGRGTHLIGYVRVCTRVHAIRYFRVGPWDTRTELTLSTQNWEGHILLPYGSTRAHASTAASAGGDITPGGTVLFDTLEFATAAHLSHHAASVRAETARFAHGVSARDLTRVHTPIPNFCSDLPTFRPMQKQRSRPDDAILFVRAGARLGLAVEEMNGILHSSR